MVWSVGVRTSAAQPLVVGGVTLADDSLYTKAKAEGKVVLYSTAAEKPLKVASDAFTADTGIRVEQVRLTTDRLYQRVLAEFSAGKLTADYVDLIDFTLVDDLARRGVFQAYKTPSFGDIDSALKDPQGRWYVLLRSLMVIGVNTSAIDGPEPKSWADLLDPKWKGRIGMPQIAAGGTAFSAYAFMRDRFGIDYWKKLSQQDPRIYPTSAPIMTDLVRGETVLSITPADQPITQKLAGAPVDAILPKEGAPSFPIAGGVTASAPRPDAAKVFMNWMTSKRAGEVLAKVNYYGVHPDAPVPAPNGKPFPDLKHVYNISLPQWEAVRTSYIREWQAMFHARGG